MSRNNDCKYNHMINCHSGIKTCMNCGWNPSVKEERLSKTYRLLKIKRIEYSAIYAQNHLKEG